ncbi:hypothetical protein FAZ19_14215 [Sphingobacterium alkalisoli]|uniref:Uncharacterized protein n=1 Tax=Sphingobacterium alkalisoli TaxID=1874115 RepID=A0A4U0GYT3_9SPHI|nr:hypothetical protein [Sphingobacterium alkalisoli]TJY64355.1 hypothetical protein FAZ19_14215 [Sphingobacterium alkalisoli]GGH22248.1 hypothetical protein GCM10011418_28680 [Sphingobacterium alkalisoli]
MDILKPIGIIDLETSKRDISYESILTLYWEFFDAAGYESHLLANDKLLRTVMSNDIYPDLYAGNAIYQLELNRRLIDLGWLYLTYKEKEGAASEISNVSNQQRYRPEFDYSHESTYYFDDYSWLRMESDKDHDPFKQEDDYKEVISRFKGKVRWLTLDEIADPYSFYVLVFDKKTHQDWIQLLTIWGEYTFLPKSICQAMDGGEVYDNYVLFQKLTEMAYLIHHYEDYIPDSRTFLYLDFCKYPSNLSTDQIIAPQMVLSGIFENSTKDGTINEFFWWVDSVLNGAYTADFSRTYNIYLTIIKLAEFCWIFKPYARKGASLKRRTENDENPYYASFFETLNYDTQYLEPREKERPLYALNWVFTSYNRDLDSLRSVLRWTFEASFQSRSSLLKDTMIKDLRTNCAKLIELTHFIYRVMLQENMN